MDKEINKELLDKHESFPQEPNLIIVNSIGDIPIWNDSNAVYKAYKIFNQDYPRSLDRVWIAVKNFLESQSVMITDELLIQASIFTLITLRSEINFYYSDQKELLSKIERNLIQLGRKPNRTNEHP